MSHIDVELKRHGKLVVHQSRRDKHTLRIAQIDIAMAHRVVAEPDVVAIGDHGVLALVHGERNEVISFAPQSSGSGIRNGSDHSFQIRGRAQSPRRDGIANSIGRLRDRSLADDLCPEIA